MAEVRRIEIESNGKAAIDKASARKIGAEARVAAAHARMSEWIVKQLEAGSKGPEEALEELLEIIHRIEAIYGGRLEIDFEAACGIDSHKSASSEDEEDENDHSK